MGRINAQNKLNKKYWTFFLSALLVGSTALPALHTGRVQADTSAPASGQTAAPQLAAAGSSANAPVALGASETQLPLFFDVLKGWRTAGAKDGTQSITLAGTDVSAQSSDAKAAAASFGGKNNVLKWDSENGWIEYQVQIDQPGLYQLDMNYKSVEMSNNPYTGPILMDVNVDGNFPYLESRNIAFVRHWKDVLPAKIDQFGDQIRPGANQLDEWIDQPFKDQQGAYASPLLWNLSKGIHTIRMMVQRGGIAIDAIHLSPPAQIPSYAQASSAVPKDSGQGQPITIEAENLTWKDDQAIQLQSDVDPYNTPAATNNIVFNTVGGNSWGKGGRSITWSFDIPADGRYQIGMRALQRFTTNLSSFRSIMVDGKVPFQEMLNYRFPYNTGWTGEVLSDSNNKPFQFYFTKGHHTLTMTSTYEPFVPLLEQLDTAGSELRSIVADLQALTGGQTDPYRTWNIDKDLPGLTDRLAKIRDQLKSMENLMVQTNGQRDDIVQGFIADEQDITNLLNNKNDIPFRIDHISTIESGVEGNIQTLKLSPLQLDKIYIVPANQSFPNMQANWFQEMKATGMSFFNSFSGRYSLISQNNPKVLNIWMQRGRDYANELQVLADQRFTPQTGIKVKVNVIQNNQQIILANAAGNQPDLALGVGTDQPFDLALRGAALNLSQFSDSKQLFDQYAPGAMLPYYFDHGYYAVPETQSFKVMYYRTDILKRLGLSVPNTWQDVYDMLPTLLQNNMNFYQDPADWSMLEYQNGAELYTKDGMKSALDTPQGFNGFQMWTDLFNIYGMEQKVPNFFNDFRQGFLPIGVTDFNMYLQLKVAAPELNGEWGMAPIPGIQQPDGSVLRWSGASASTADMIMAKSTKVDQAWQFMKWWESADIQAQFGNDLEQYNGETFRWNTANVAAFVQLPWERSELNVILQQWRWIKELPNVPGSYMTGREMLNAWNRSVADTTSLKNPRESLETAIMNINTEMLRKQQEFHYVDQNGNYTKSLDLPVVTQPWTGGDKYVR